MISSMEHYLELFVYLFSGISSQIQFLPTYECYILLLMVLTLFLFYDPLDSLLTSVEKEPFNSYEGVDSSTYSTQNGLHILIRDTSL